MIACYRNRVLSLAAVMALSAVPGRSIADDKPLVAFDQNLMKHVEAGKGNVGGVGVDTDGRATVLVLSRHEAGGRSIAVVKPEAGVWNLADHEAITIGLRNPTKAPVTVYARAENPNAGRLTDGSQNAVELQPGESKTLIVRLTRTPDDPTYQVFAPYYMYFKNMNVRDNTLDPAQVARLTIAVDDWLPGQNKVEVTAITATGTGKPLPTPFFPFIDSYGQYVHGDWPGKIYTDADFADRVKEEARERAAWPGPADRTEYGGWAKGPTLKATGFFYAAKHDGKWWLVDPTGHLFWSYGPTGVGFGGDVSPITDRQNWFVSLPDENQFADFYRNGRSATYMYYRDKSWRGLDIQRLNLFRKYGPDFEKIVPDILHERLKSWGFNSIGNWSEPKAYLMHKTPYTVAIHPGDPGGALRAGDGHSIPDIYHPDWAPGVYKRMERERNTTANDPWNLGYFIDNERAFGWRPRAAQVGELALKAKSDQPLKLELIKLLKKKYPTIDALNTSWKTQYASWDALQETRETPNLKDNKPVLDDFGDFGMQYAERYFSICRDAVKKVAPNNMYLGSRFYGHTDPAVVELAGKFCDVISYNIYDNPPTNRVNGFNKLDLPILSTEWGVESDILQTPFRDAKLTTVLPKERAQKIVQYVEAALRHPNMVGAHFFQFRDQPLSGRPDGEATLRGFVNVADTPNFELVQTNRRLGYGMYEFRANAK
ncbi:MAG: hypothetical protein QM754_14525 [Tepidisphaeraceae bacterium]